MSRLGLYVTRGGVGDGWRGAGWVRLAGPGNEGGVWEERVEMAFWLTSAAGERAAGRGRAGRFGNDLARRGFGLFIGGGAFSGEALL